VHVPGEPVCYYLLNSGKVGALERFANDPVFAECTAKLPEIAERHPEIGRKVEKAAKSGFRSAHLIGRNAVQDALA
jgi:hypothetical protein